VLVQAYQRRENAPLEPLEVHVTGLCYRRLQGTWFVLLQRRAADRALYPNLLEGCGGRLHPGETFKEGVFRHFATELGVKVIVLETHDFYEINCPEGLIQGVRFLCTYMGEVDKASFDVAMGWHMREVVVGMNDQLFIPGVKAKVLAWFDELSVKNEAA